MITGWRVVSGVIWGVQRWPKALFRCGASRFTNLKGVNLDIPHRQLVVFCGLSGSGKKSLALDTLYAEGQRRYIETFSAYTRQFLQRLERPAAEQITGIPPAVAVTHKSVEPFQPQHGRNRYRDERLSPVAAGENRPDCLPNVRP